MSLILEALKKSEEQRRLGEVPGLNTAYRTKPRRRTGPLWVLLVSIVLVAGAFASWRWYLDPAADSSVPVAAQSVPTAAPPSQRTQPQAGTPQRADNVTETAVSASPPSNLPALASASELAPDQPKNERESEAIPPDMEILRTVDTSSAVERGTEFANSPDLRRPFEHTPEWEGELGLTEQPTSPPVAADTPQSSATRSAPAEPALADSNALPATYELPYTVRRELPELRLTMHYYSTDAASRFVILNGERRLEGDQLGEDIQISEIVPDGVVLVFRGQRTLLPRLGT